MMLAKSAGFTLIELVAVIVILGILMAVAIPKFVDFSGRAKQAADRGQLTALRSATYVLYTANILNNHRPDGTHFWPARTSIWAQLESTNAWQFYNPTNVSYSQTSGVWSVTGGE